jgi:hypothetical protein
MAKTVAEEIVDHFEADYALKYGDAIPFAFGELERATEDALRRVVFVRLGGALVEPNHAGGIYISPAFTSAELRFAAIEDVTAHIYAEDSGTVEAIHRNLVILIADCLLKAATFEKYIWRTEQPGEAQHTNRQHKIEQPMTWRLGVTDAPIPLVRIEGSGFSHECEFGAGEFSAAEFSRDFKLFGGEAD